VWCVYVAQIGTRSLKCEPRFGGHP